MSRETLPAPLNREPKSTKSPVTVTSDTSIETTYDPALTTVAARTADPASTDTTHRYNAARVITPAQVLRMQKTQGNRAVLRMLDKRQVQQSGEADLGIQRHSSFEHRLLGDARPEDLNAVASKVSPSTRNHVLTLERQRLQIWQKDPQSVSAAQVQSTWPDAHVLTLKNGLVVTYGELNTMGDYFPNPDAFDNGDVSVVLPILQMVRQQGFNRITDLVGATRTESFSDPMGMGGGSVPVEVADYQHFKGAIGPDGETGTLASIDELQSLNKDTKNLGTDQYQSLVSRNACHFAPYSWSRWEEFHRQARDQAKLGFDKKDQALIRQAWITNGFADHFLQDSFAAGHLINKTLIMQWFVDWVKDYNSKTKWYERNIHLDNWDKVQHMGTAEQPGLAGRNLYGSAWTPGSAGSTDPQTAEEQGTKKQRMDAAGVRAGGGKSQDEEYANYLAFLNNAVIQQASGKLHDHFNERGLWVGSAAHPQAYLIMGDDTMVAKGDGVQIAGETAHNSQKAIDDIIRTGDSKIKPEDIRKQFPSMVGPVDGSAMLPIEQWQDTLRTLCWTKIFPSVNYRILSTINTTMGKVSKDAS